MLAFQKSIQSEQKLLHCQYDYWIQYHILLHYTYVMSILDKIRGNDTHELFVYIVAGL